ncbi:hypothetical protein AAC387_Pa01g0850 [Persea americana]
MLDGLVSIGQDNAISCRRPEKDAVHVRPAPPLPQFSKHGFPACRLTAGPTRLVVLEGGTGSCFSLHCTVACHFKNRSFRSELGSSKSRVIGSGFSPDRIWCLDNFPASLLHWSSSSSSNRL